MLPDAQSCGLSTYRATEPKSQLEWLPISV